MAKLDESTAEKLENAVVSLVQLKQELNRSGGEFDESHIDWLEVDIQGLNVITQRMGTEFYKDA